MIIFCHTVDHVQRTLQQRIVDKDTILIPTSPEAAWECQKRGISYSKIDTFIDKEALFHKRAIVLRTNMDWLHFVDDALQQFIPKFNENQFRPARLYTFAFFGFLDELYISGYILKSIYHELKPSRIYNWAPPFTLPGTWSRIMPRGVFYPFFIKQLTARYGVEVINLSDSNEYSSPTDSSNRNNKNNWNIDPLYSFYRSAGKLFPAKFKREFKLMAQFGAAKYFSSTCASLIRIKNENKFLFLGEGYDLDSLCIELRLRGCKVNRPEDPSALSIISSDKENALKKELTDAWDSITVQSAFWRPFSSAGLEPNDISHWILKRWWFDILPRQWIAFERAKVLFDNKHYSGVVNWAFGEGVNGAIIGAAKATNVSSFCWQHGGASRNIWEIDTLQELFLTDYYFAYGLGTKRMFDSVSRTLLNYGKPAEVIPVGSGRLDTIRENTKNEKYTALRKRIMKNAENPLVLYIPTVYEAAGWRLADLLSTGVTYFEFQQEIISLFNQYKDIEFIYKGFPGTLDSVPYNPIKDYVNMFENKNIYYIDDVPVTKLMWAADVLIIDHNQTAINELLLTRKPVLVFEQGSMSERVTEPIAIELLKKRASLACTQKEFLNMIDKFLQKGDFSELQYPNDEYLKEYGTHMNDGLSAYRAADYMLKLLN